MSFPDPGDSTTHTIGSKVWTWDNEKWVLQTVSVGAPAFAATAPVVVDAQATTTTYSLDATTLSSIDGGTPASTTSTSSSGSSSSNSSSSGGSY